MPRTNEGWRGGRWTRSEKDRQIDALLAICQELASHLPDDTTCPYDGCLILAGEPCPACQQPIECLGCGELVPPDEPCRPCARRKRRAQPPAPLVRTEGIIWRPDRHGILRAVS